MGTRELFFELIRVSVGTGKQLSRTPSPKEWEELMQLALDQTLAGVLLDGIKRLPHEQCPPKPLLMNWHNASEMIAQTNRQMEHDTVWVSQRWKKVGYSNIILKGQGNALLYPNPLSRTSGDIDIWLDGQRKDIVRYIKRMFPHEEVTRIEMNFPIKKGTSIEVHFIPSFMYDPFVDRRMQRYFQEQMKRPETVRLADGEIQIPNLEMNLVFQLTHIYRHLFYEGIGLRQLMDYFFLLKKAESEERGQEILKAATVVIRNLKLNKFCAALMWVEQEVFGLPEEQTLVPSNEKEGRFLLSEMMRAGNFGHADDRVGNWGEMNRWQRLTWGTKWALRLLPHYPREVMWHPVYRIAQYFWRLKNGYL